MKTATKGQGKAKHQVASWDSVAGEGEARCGAAVDGDLTFAELGEYLKDPAACRSCKKSVEAAISATSR